MVTLRGRFRACPWFPVGGKPALARAVPSSSVPPGQRLAGAAHGRREPARTAAATARRRPERIVRDRDGWPTRSAALRAEGRTFRPSCQYEARSFLLDGKKRGLAAIRDVR